MSMADEIEKLKRLNDAGVLTSEEFAAAKERLLRQDQPVPPLRPVSTPDAPKSGAKVFRIRTLIGLLLLGMVLWVAYSFMVAATPELAGNPNRPRTMLEAAGNAIRSPQVLVNEDWIVDAGGMKWLEVTVPTARPVSVQVQGLRDSAKGFSVYRVSMDELRNLKARKAFRHDPAFHGDKVRRFEHTATVAQGKMAFVVVNSENLLNSMMVRVKIVVDP